MKARQTEADPASVPARAKQAGEPQARWSWVEPSVWTERMLTALEVGVKGGKWYSLIDKVSSLRNLESAFAQVKSNQPASCINSLVDSSQRPGYWASTAPSSSVSRSHRK